MQKWIDTMKWEIITAIIAAIGFFQLVAFNILKAQFMTREECDKTQTRCNLSVCKQIEELRQDLKAYRIDAENKRDEAREKFTEQLGQIRIFMARIDQKIQDDRWGDNGKGGII